MAKEKDTQKEVQPVINEKLTQEEYDKINRNKTRERIYKVARVVGIGTIVLLIYVGLIDLLFELSFFGALFLPEQYKAGWNALAAIGRESALESFIGATTGRVFDDILGIGAAFNGTDAYKGAWMAQIGVTGIFIGVIALSVYIFTYSIVDIVDFVKNLIKSIKTLRKDIYGNVKEGLDKLGVKKKEKKTADDKVEEEKKEKVKRRRAPKVVSEENTYTSEQLDALLKGEVLPEPISNVEIKNGEKPLF